VFDVLHPFAHGWLGAISEQPQRGNQLLKLPGCSLLIPSKKVIRCAGSSSHASSASTGVIARIKRLLQMQGRVVLCRVPYTLHEYPCKVGQCFAVSLSRNFYKGKFGVVWEKGVTLCVVVDECQV
jgi:hypothetical protein